jgi:hypothetical protein
MQEYYLDLLTLFTTVIVIMVQRYAVFNMRMLSILTLPSTFLHELAHYLVAIVTYGRPDKFNIYPQKTEDGGYVLGYVTFVPTWYNAPIIGLAPLLLFPLAWLSYAAGVDSDFTGKLIYGALAGTCLNGGVPSGVDLSFIYRYPMWLLVSIFGAVTYYFPDFSWL